VRPLFSFVAAALLVGCASDYPHVAVTETLSAQASAAAATDSSTDAAELSEVINSDLPGCDATVAKRTLRDGSDVKLRAVRTTDLVIASVGGLGVCVDTLKSLEVTLPKLATASRVSSNPMPGTDPAASNPMPGDDKGGSNPMPGTGR